MPVLTSLVRANTTLTSTGVAANLDTVTVGGKTYTWQTTLTNVDGNVLIGASAAASLVNLADAIKLVAASAGVGYAAAMTRNENANALTPTATTLVIESKVSGTIGNLIATTKVAVNFAFTGATMAGGVGGIAQAITEIKLQMQLNSDVLQVLDLIDGSSNSSL